MANLKDSFSNYSKHNGDSDLRDSLDGFDSSNEGLDVLKQEYIPIIKGYEKEAGSIPSFLIVVISGGEVREGDYLSELSKKQTFPKVKLIFKSSEKGKGGLSPMLMVRKFYETIEMENPIKTHKILYSSIDKIFMVTDVDHYLNELVTILNRCHLPNATWIISNPCFEIWLYYSYFDHICEEIKILESIPQSKQSSTLKHLNHKMIDGGIDPRKAFEQIENAIQNSKSNYSEDKNGIPKLFCTNMHVMGEYIFEAIGQYDFEKWLDEKRKRIEAYRSRLK